MQTEVPTEKIMDQALPPASLSEGDTIQFIVRKLRKMDSRQLHCVLQFVVHLTK